MTGRAGEAEPSEPPDNEGEQNQAPQEEQPTRATSSSGGEGEAEICVHADGEPSASRSRASSSSGGDDVFEDALEQQEDTLECTISTTDDWKQPLVQAICNIGVGTDVILQWARPLRDLVLSDDLSMGKLDSLLGERTGKLVQATEDNENANSPSNA